MFMCGYVLTCVSEPGNRCMLTYVCMCPPVSLCLYMGVCTRVHVYASAFVCMSVSTYMCALQLHGRMYSRQEEAEGGVSGLASGFQRAPDVTFALPWGSGGLCPWRPENFLWEPRGLTACGGRKATSRSMGPSSRRPGRSREPCLIPKECVWVPAQQSRPQPDREPRSTRQQWLPLEQGACWPGTSHSRDTQSHK